MKVNAMSPERKWTVDGRDDEARAMRGGHEADDYTGFCRCKNPKPRPVPMWGVMECGRCGHPVSQETMEAINAAGDEAPVEKDGPGWIDRGLRVGVADLGRPLPSRQIRTTRHGGRRDH